MCRTRSADTQYPRRGCQEASTPKGILSRLELDVDGLTFALLELKFAGLEHRFSGMGGLERKLLCCRSSLCVNASYLYVLVAYHFDLPLWGSV